MDHVHNETIPVRNLAPPPVCHKSNIVTDCCMSAAIGRLHGRKVDILSGSKSETGESGDARRRQV